MNQPDESWGKTEPEGMAQPQVDEVNCDFRKWVGRFWLELGLRFGGVKGNAQGKPPFVAFFGGFPTRRHTCIAGGLNSLTSKNPTICIGEAKRQWGSK